MKKIIAVICICTISLSFSLCSCKSNQISDAAKAIKETYNEYYGDESKAKSSDKAPVYSDCFKNKDFLASIAECFDKTPDKLTEQDILSVRYISIGPDAFGQNILCLGCEEYENTYFSDEYETAEEKIEDLKPLVSQVNIKATDNTDYSDLALFKNVSVFELYEIPVSDVSFIKNYANLAYGYFSNNGITDISALSDFRPESLMCLDFTGNDIKDWSALKDISDKIITNYLHTSEGDYVSVLTDLLDGVSAPLEEQPDTGEETTGDEETVYFEPENDVDWSVLFGE